MSGAQLDAALQQLVNAPPSGPSPALIKHFLQLIRETKTRRSDAVWLFGSLLLTKHAATLPQDERWQVQEQVAIAAMDCHAYDSAHALIQSISDRFPKSLRAARLQGMFYELVGRWGDAAELYEATLKDHPAQPYIWKRKVAVQRGQGNIPAAIDTLVKYLDLSPLDADAWLELCELYLSAQLHTQAAFCCEELVLLNPSSTDALLRYADVLHTQHTPASLHTARTYYSAVVQLTQGEDVRALYGVCATTAAMATTPRGRQGSSGPAAAPVKESPEDLGQLAATRLLQLYASRQPTLVPVVQESLAGMGFRR